MSKFFFFRYEVRKGVNVELFNQHLKKLTN